MDDKCQIILNEIRNADVPIQYKDLISCIHTKYTDTKMSNSTLSRCLKKLEYSGLIKSESVRCTHGVGKAYSLTHCDHYFDIYNNVDEFKQFVDERPHIKDRKDGFGFESLQYLKINDHLDTIVKKIIDEMYIYANSENAKESQRFDTFVSAALKPHIVSLKTLAKPNNEMIMSEDVKNSLIAAFDQTHFPDLPTQRTVPLVEDLSPEEYKKQHDDYRKTICLKSK